jgi:hypothetical protein
MVAPVGCPGSEIEEMWGCQPVRRTVLPAATLSLFSYNRSEWWHCVDLAVTTLASP